MSDAIAIEAATKRLALALDALDAAAAHSHQLEATTREVARRLDLAMASIRSVIDAHDR